jgi:hypothetical protein
MTDLVITNGDTAAELLAAAGVRAVILPWQDVLHEGPVLPGPLEVCSAERTRYLAQRFRIPVDEVAAGFAERDAVIRRSADFERIELWFEHDLYDQLQLVQVLTALGPRENVTLVQADDFLGRQTADTILRFVDRVRRVEPEDVVIATRVWAAITAPTPEGVAAEVGRLDGRLPWLKPALVRFLEELPSPVSGLGRTEAAILDGIAVGTRSPPRLFQEVLLEEDAAFMGDASFFGLIDDMASCEVPLIAGIDLPGDAVTDADRYREAELELTLAGEEVANGDEDHVDLNGIDRWWGGTHLTGRATWRYDRTAAKLVAPGGA